LSDELIEREGEELLLKRKEEGGGKAGHTMAVTTAFIKR